MDGLRRKSAFDKKQSMANRIGIHFTMRVGELCKRRDISTERALAEVAEISPTQAHKVLSGHFENSRNGPSAIVIKKLAIALGTTADDLLGPKESPNIPTLFEIHCNNGATLSAFSQFKDYGDVYKRPRDGYTFLERVGKKSLLATQSRLTDPELLQSEFMLFNAATRRSIYEAQRLAWDVGAMATTGHINHTKSSRIDGTVNVRYWRASFRVLNDQGDARLLIFCGEIDGGFPRSDQ